MTIHQQMKKVALELENDPGPSPTLLGIRRGEVFLAFGTAALVLTLAVTHLVMGFYLAIVPGALAFVFLSAGSFMARNRTSSGETLPVGLLLLFAGFSIIIITGFQASRLSYRAALAEMRPSLAPLTLGDWLFAAVTWFLPIGFIAPGLKRWTDWTPGRRLFWCLISFFVPLAIFIVHQILVARGFAITA